MKLKQNPNINLINQNIKNNKDTQPSFKGGEVITQALTYLQTNQAIGATFVDAACMCTPRTIVDFTRSPEAGVETARREFSSNINNASLGAYGMGAAWLFAQGLKNEYGINANKMFIDNETLDILSDIRYKHKNLKDPTTLRNYCNEFLDATTCYDPNKNTQVAIKTAKDDIVNKLVEYLNDDTTKSSKQAKKQFAETKAYVKSLLVRETGNEADYKLERIVSDIKDKNGNTKTLKSVSTADDYIDNFCKLTKAFMSEKVSSTFESGKVSDNLFIKKLKGLNAKTAILGVAICAGIGAAVQPINMYLTKKKTGKSGFVGGGKEDKSEKFKMLKSGVAALAGLGTILSIGKPSKLLSEIQFKGFCPTIPQFKLVYGITIISRLLSSRNENELRESTIKDSLGFANWLILGGFVSKLAAAGFEKFSNGEKFIKYDAKVNGNSFAKWISNASIVTREEVLQAAMKKLNLSAFKDVDGKKVALSMKEMLTTFSKNAGVKSKIRKLGVIQLAGYVYSAIVLGVGIPKLNIAITKAVEKKQKAEKIAEEIQQKSQAA